MSFFQSGHTPALACAPNKDVADCLALILSTMKPFPQRDSCSCSSPTVSPSPGLNLLKHCGITAACAPLPSNGLHNGYVKDRHGAPVGLDGCLSEWGRVHPPQSAAITIITTRGWLPLTWPRGPGEHPPTRLFSVYVCVCASVCAWVFGLLLRCSQT